MLILPETRIIEAHDLLLADPFGISDDVPLAVEITALQFSLGDLRRRGRFLPALRAPSFDRAAAWFGDQVVPQLPAINEELPRGFSGEDIWREFARSQGDWAHDIQRRSRMTQSAFERLVAMSEQQGLLYRLPRWYEPGSADEEAFKLYLTDPGLMHRLLGWDEQTYNQGPTGVSLSRINRFWRDRDKSWEGFVIGSIIRAAGPGAKATVWEVNPGEIDLILEWTRDTWAIEVTRGHNKKFREIHGLGRRATGSTRPIMLVYDDEVGIPELKGALKLGHNVECLTLAQTLREVRTGP